jgi:hypothetical protein
MLARRYPRPAAQAQTLAFVASLIAILFAVLPWFGFGGDQQLNKYLQSSLLGQVLAALPWVAVLIPAMVCLALLCGLRVGAWLTVARISAPLGLALPSLVLGVFAVKAEGLDTLAFLTMAHISFWLYVVTTSFMFGALTRLDATPAARQPGTVTNDKLVSMPREFGKTEVATRLRDLEALRESGAITRAEYEEARLRIIGDV